MAWHGLVLICFFLGTVTACSPRERLSSFSGDRDPTPVLSPVESPLAEVSPAPSPEPTETAVEGFVPFESLQDDGTILMFAHQDDDLIWMLPFWNNAAKFVLAAMPTTSKFRTFIDLQEAFLATQNPALIYKPLWSPVWGDITQVEYEGYYWNRDRPKYEYLTKQYLVANFGSDSAIIEREVSKIKAKIETIIATPAVKRIVTHNNWGEYGHDHHCGVNRAVRELAVKYKKDVWVLGMISINTKSTAGDVVNTVFEDLNPAEVGIEFTRADFNDGVFRGIYNIYLNNGLWTGNSLGLYPDGTRVFLKVVSAGNDASINNNKIRETIDRVVALRNVCHGQ